MIDSIYLCTCFACCRWSEKGAPFTIGFCFAQPISPLPYPRCQASRLWDMRSWEWREGRLPPGAPWKPQVDLDTREGPDAAALPVQQEAGSGLRGEVGFASCWVTKFVRRARFGRLLL